MARWACVCRPHIVGEGDAAAGGAGWRGRGGKEEEEEEDSLFRG